MPWTVYTRHGQRKYLTAAEIDLFVREARAQNEQVRTFCWMLAYTGCRISEALALTANSVDFEAQHVIIKCLKKRGKRVFRAIPIPSAFLNALQRWFRSRVDKTELLWPWSRMTGYRRICEVMDKAGIKGSYASPKGLRHGFGIRAIQASVPLTLVQRWLGHADIKTTAIYTSAIGPEERAIAARMWTQKTAGKISMSPYADENHAEIVLPAFGATPENRLTLHDRRPGESEADERQDIDMEQYYSETSLALRPPPGQKPSRIGRFKQMIACPLLQFWLQCNTISFDFSKTCSDLLNHFPALASTVDRTMSLSI